MQLKADQLPGHFSKGTLAPVYVVSGDEPLQVKEASDAIRAEARRQGFTERQVMEVGRDFDWNQLAAEVDALSLFADKRLFDLRIPGGKPGAEGARALAQYVERATPDNLLLVILPKLDRSQRSAKWFAALEKAGVVVTIWPVDRHGLAGWLRRRAAAQGLTLDAEAAAFIAGQTEGNLLAAAQEIDKLRLLTGGGNLGMPEVAASVSGSARYNVYELADAMLGGETAQSLRMLSGMRAEGTAAPVVLWVLAKELRALEGIAAALAAGDNPGRAMQAQGVWKSRQPLVSKAARRAPPARWRRLLGLCALADLAIKGQAAADPWVVMEDVVLAASGARGRIASAAFR